MDDFYTGVADTCTEIINDPTANVSKISKLLKTKENPGVVHLSLMKVFKRIVPLYRVRVHSEKVKHRNGELAVSAFDRELVQQYNAYVKEICTASSGDSFRCACELLHALDHFNFADRIVSKVLVGTSINSAVGALCADALVDRIRNDTVGDTVFMIINQCLDHKYSHRIVDALVESAYLRRCVEMKIDKEEKYNKQRIEQKKLEKRGKRQKGFFEKAPIFSKSARKEEKKRLIMQNAAKKGEDESLGLLDDRNYVRTVNALQRLYFTVLKESIESCLHGTFVGLRAFFRLIRAEFREGLYVLLNDAVKVCGVKARLEGIRTILAVYGEGGLDFKRIIDLVFSTLHPLDAGLEGSDYRQVQPIVKQLFVDIKQPQSRINALVQRLMQARAMRFIPQYTETIKMLEAVYDIDFADHDIKTKDMYDPGNPDIDRIETKPFYEYYLFKKVI